MTTQGSLESLSKKRGAWNKKKRWKGVGGELKVSVSWLTSLKAEKFLNELFRSNLHKTQVLVSLKKTSPCQEREQQPANLLIAPPKSLPWCSSQGRVCAHQLDHFYIHLLISPCSRAQLSAPWGQGRHQPCLAWSSFSINICATELNLHPLFITSTRQSVFFFLLAFQKFLGMFPNN